KATLPRGETSAQNRPRPVAGWADAPPSLAQRRRERQSYQGASGGPDSAANRAAGRADTPRWRAVALHGGPGGSPAALCHFLSAEKVKPGVALRPEYHSNESPAQQKPVSRRFRQIKNR